MQTKLTLKTILPYLIMGILIVMASFFMKGCHDKPYVNAKSDNAVLNDFIQRKGVLIQTIMSNNKTLSLKIDSLSKLKPIYIKGKVRIKDSLIFVSDSNCIRNLTILYNECQKIDSINNVIIDNLSTQNANLVSVTNNQQDVIDMQKYKIKSDSSFIKDEFPKEYKRGLKKGRKQGIIIGAAIETAVIVGGLILVK